jgi:hypothetical protein
MLNLYNNGLIARPVVLNPNPDKPEELVDIRYWSLARDFLRLSGDGCGCEARVGIRNTVTVMNDRNRIALNETSRATEERLTNNW